jgi:hypothetical protein
MRNRSLASLLRASGILASVLLALFAVYGPSVVAHQDAPGNNGTVKIHEGADEPSPSEVRNEPHVCTFHLHFYFADPEQAGNWEIQEWAPTGEKGKIVKAGTYDTAGDGEDRDPASGAYDLPDGHYKLFWDGDDGKHDKMKVFWVECGTSGGEQPEESESASPTGSELPEENESESPSGGGEQPEESESASPTGSELPAENGSPSPTGGEEGAEGTPPGGGTGGSNGGVLGAVGTPPATDTADVQPAPSNDGWRFIALALAGLIGLTAALMPRPRRAEVRVQRPRDDR